MMAAAASQAASPGVDTLEAELGVLKANHVDVQLGGLVAVEAQPSLPRKRCRLVLDNPRGVCCLTVSDVEEDEAVTAAIETNRKRRRWLRRGSASDGLTQSCPNFELDIAGSAACIAVNRVHDTLLASITSPAFRIDVQGATYVFQCVDEQTREQWLSKLFLAVDKYQPDTYEKFRTANMTVYRMDGLRKGRYYLVIQAGDRVCGRTSAVDVPFERGRTWAREPMFMAMLPNTGTNFVVHVVNARRNDTVTSFSGDLKTFLENEDVELAADESRRCVAHLRGQYRELATLTPGISQVVEKTLSVNLGFSIACIRDILDRTEAKDAVEVTGYKAWIPAVVHIMDHMCQFEESQDADLDLLRMLFQREIEAATETDRKQAQGWKCLLRENNACSLAMDTILSLCAKPILRKTICPLMWESTGQKKKAGTAVVREKLKQVCASLANVLGSLHGRFRQKLCAVAKKVAEAWPEHDVLRIILITRLLCPALTNPQDRRFALSRYASKSNTMHVNLSKCLMKLASGVPFAEDHDLAPLNDDIAVQRKIVVAAFRDLLETPAKSQGPPAKWIFMRRRHLSIWYFTILQHKELFTSGNKDYASLFTDLQRVRNLKDSGSISLSRRGHGSVRSDSGFEPGSTVYGASPVSPTTPGKVQTAAIEEVEEDSGVAVNLPPRQAIRRIDLVKEGMPAEAAASPSRRQSTLV